MSDMHVVALQLDIVWEEKAANFSQVRALLEKQPPRPGSLIVLPEMFSTGFSLNLAVTKQTPEREDEQFLSALAVDYASFVIGGVVSPGTGEKGANEAVAYSPDGALIARYRKIHPFSLGGEAGVHEAGSQIVTFKWGRFTVAPFVCYDLRFPEIFRDASRQGADLFIVMALWPVKRQQHWLTLLQARAIENQACVIGVNRTGNDPLYSYAGRSVAINCHGIITADAGEQERVLTATLDPEATAAWRRDFPALRDAHPPMAAAVPAV
ncbi:MAG: Nitrilase/cyanide hydratase and apolipoprotein N-acyltransferase [Chthoniobacteraceae bacterium]|nr:Nitrilase/cyanide hydratase and apolipoprotein N-acyltransferase [Chthoniobacteraceae bacterium]